MTNYTINDNIWMFVNDKNEHVVIMNNKGTFWEGFIEDLPEEYLDWRIITVYPEDNKLIIRAVKRTTN